MTTIEFGAGEVKRGRGRPPKQDKEKEVKAEALAESLTSKIKNIPPVPQIIKPKEFHNIGMQALNTQNTIIKQALKLLEEKEDFFKVWAIWISTIREANDTIKQAREVVISLGNKKVEIIEKAYKDTMAENEVLKGQIDDLRKRVKLLLGG